EERGRDRNPSDPRVREEKGRDPREAQCGRGEPSLVQREGRADKERKDKDVGNGQVVPEKERGVETAFQKRDPLRARKAGVVLEDTEAGQNTERDQPNTQRSRAIGGFHRPDREGEKERRKEIP